MSHHHLEALIGRACGQLTERAAKRAAGLSDEEELGGLLFFGNPMETTPRRLLVDERLSPVDKVGWMAFRMFSSKDRETAFPSYEALQRLLSSRADGSQASKSTINRVIFILRLTRWLSLCHQARNTSNGRMVGNIYALHDDPIPIVDASNLDTGYIAFVGRCRSHGNQAVRKVAQLVFDELAEDKTTRYLMTRLGLFEERLADHELSKAQPRAKKQNRTQAGDSQKQNQTRVRKPSSKIELREEQNETLLDGTEFENETQGPTESKSGGNTGFEPRVRNSNPGTVRTVLTAVDVSVRTGHTQELDWSRLNLKPEEKPVIQRYMAGIPAELHQIILDEAAARISQIRNMPAYLVSLVDKAKTGTLKTTTASARPTSQAPAPQPPATPSLPIAAPAPPPEAGRNSSALGKPVDIARELSAIRALVGRQPTSAEPEELNHE